MASAAVSDVVTSIPRHPYTMVDLHRSHQDANNNNNDNHTNSSSSHDQSYDSSQSPAVDTPESSASRPIDIPQSARQPQSEERQGDDPFSQHRPPKHDFSGTQAYEQLRAAQGQPEQNAPPASSQTASDAGNAPQQPSSSSRPQIATANVQRHAQNAARTSQPSNPPTAPQSPQLLPTIRSALSMSGGSSPMRVKVRDLNHIQSFASEEVLSRNNSTARLRGGAGRADEGGGGGAAGVIQTYDIASMPVQDIIEMVAGLLTKITNTNDKAHERDIKSHIPNLQNAAAVAAAGVNEPNPSNGTQRSSSPGQAQSTQIDIRGMHRQTQSVLSFHGKNVPSISILMYLSRIHKYCPTTYEVFLSLLVYFDRMTENINKGIVHSFRNLDPMDSDEIAAGSPPPSRQGRSADDVIAQGEEEGAGKVGIDAKPPVMHPFVVDSFNIHRLIMAGVTCASKFFSDVFYTNSRYAKVGGLPLHELNHLELQFLLLNDFKLFIPIDELEHYGSLLVQFYAEEIMTQQAREKQEKEERKRKEKEERQRETNGSEEDTADEGVHMQT